MSDRSNLFLFNLFLFFICSVSLQLVFALHITSDSEHNLQINQQSSLFDARRMEYIASSEEKCVLDVGEPQYDECKFNADCFGVTCHRLGNTFKMNFDCERNIITVALNKKNQTLVLNTKNVVKDSLTLVKIEPYTLESNENLMMLTIKYGTVICPTDKCLIDGLKQILPSNISTLCKSMEWSINFAKSYPEFTINQQPVSTEFAIATSLIAAENDDQTPIWVEYSEGKLQKLLKEIEDFDYERFTGEVNLDNKNNNGSISPDNNQDLNHDGEQESNPMAINAVTGLICVIVGGIVLTVVILLTIKRHRNYSKYKSIDNYENNN